MSMVDESNIPMRSAVELSYLPPEQQRLLQDVIEGEDYAPSHVQAVKLRKLSSEGCLNNDVIRSIMQEDRSAPAKHFKVSGEKIYRFFPAGTPAQTIEETIIKALELWYNNR